MTAWIWKSTKCRRPSDIMSGNHDMCVPVPKQNCQTKEKPEDIAMIPDQQVVLNNISTPLAKYNIKVIHIPVKKNIYILRPIKDKLHLRVKSIYSNPCEHGKVYSWTDGNTVKTNC
jgi:hypothetical protein